MKTKSSFKQKSFLPLRAVLLLSLVLFGQLSTAAAKEFSDLGTSSKYFTAIQYLSDLGIISGYPDGTFQPDKNVSRVEFLKLVLESSGIEANINTSTGFSDVNEGAWYAKYVRKAKSEGWIEGYGDNTFKPEQAINKVEGLKIIAEVQQWEVDASIKEAPFADIALLAWYTPYIDYAKTKNFLEETGRFFIPDSLLSRGRVSDILFRIHLTAKTNAEAFSTSLIKYADVEIEPEDISPSVGTQNPVIPETPALNFNPVGFGTTSANFFTNITLNESFPNTFYLNEVYYFEGKANSGNYSKAFVFLAPENETNSSKYINYVVEISGSDFKIPVIFRETGNYKLGMILGNSGESKIVNISVLPSLPEPSTAETSAAPSTPAINYKNQRTTFSWQEQNDSIYRLLVFQGNKTKVFLFRQNINSFDVDYRDFADFEEGKVFYILERAETEDQKPLKIKKKWKSGNTNDFLAAQHILSIIEKDLISVPALPELVTKMGAIH